MLILKNEKAQRTSSLGFKRVNFIESFYFLTNFSVKLLPPLPKSSFS